MIYQVRFGIDDRPAVCDCDVTIASTIGSRVFHRLVFLMQRERAQMVDTVVTAGPDRLL